MNDDDDDAKNLSKYPSSNIPARDEYGDVILLNGVDAHGIAMKDESTGCCRSSATELKSQTHTNTDPDMRTMMDKGSMFSTSVDDAGRNRDSGCGMVVVEMDACGDAGEEDCECE